MRWWGGQKIYSQAKACGYSTDFQILSHEILRQPFALLRTPTQND